MGEVVVVGVRHHSPACARLVAKVVRARRPKYVLVEGPSDMNARIGELLLPHRLPVALFTWRQDGATGATRGTWTPFCAYSPEWVAIATAAEVGATPLFMDLPAWHDAFDGEENRYSDRHVRASDSIAEVCARLGFEGTDALWDHLFEGAGEDEAALARYFEALRADEPGGPRDEPREAYMAQWMAWAAAEAGAGDVVAVCGGYHKPALERLWRTSRAEEPALAAPVGARLGSYLVPFSSKRLDAFAGYASGMPSPAFYQAVWELGPVEGAERMLEVAIRHLRARAQRVSPADAIAARTLAEGLRTLRGHGALARIDVLDGLAGALVKEALDAPLPWTRRGRLAPRTDPMLVELVAAFSGDLVGELAPGTPRPPLAEDVWAELARVGFEVGRAEAKARVDLQTARGIEQSRVLHRLRVLQIPGFARTRGPSIGRHDTSFTETWTLTRLLETDTALVEASVHGATLETAAAAKLEAQTLGAAGLGELAEGLVEAALAGIAALTERWLAGIAARVGTEADLAALGLALARLLALVRGEVVLTPRETSDVAQVVLSCFDRGMWLFEGIQGDTAAPDPGLVAAVAALREASRLPALSGEAPRARALCERRARDAEAPPSVRGAALGWAWSVWGLAAGDEVAILKSVARAATLGDFLLGLFALAREEVLRAPELLAAIDVATCGFTEDDFLVALPALRQAFAFFPPRERLRLAEGLLASEGGDARTLVGAKVDAGLVVRAREREIAARDLARRFGLEDALDSEGGAS